MDHIEYVEDDVGCIERQPIVSQGEQLHTQLGERSTL
jgi:hypothetical protein